MMTIRQLEQEITRLKTDADVDRRQAERFRTQSNFHEMSRPELSTISTGVADRYDREAQDFEARIAECRQQIESLKRDVERLHNERDELRRQADEKDRQAKNIQG